MGWGEGEGGEGVSRDGGNWENEKRETRKSSGRELKASTGPKEGGGSQVMVPSVFLYQGCPPTPNCGRPSTGRGNGQREVS